METHESNAFNNEQPLTNSKDTFRSFKSPDQCVISYNFQQAHSFNFTHNLLIGMGLDQPRKNNKKNQSFGSAEADKSKLFSIITQPKSLFKQETRSVARAYQANVIPKRYIAADPSKIKRLKNNTDHQQSDKSRFIMENKQRNQKQNYEEGVGARKRSQWRNYSPQHNGSDDLNFEMKSPYEEKQRVKTRKTQKFKVIDNRIEERENSRQQNNTQLSKNQMNDSKQNKSKRNVDKNKKQGNQSKINSKDKRQGKNIKTNINKNNIKKHNLGNDNSIKGLKQGSQFQNNDESEQCNQQSEQDQNKNQSLESINQHTNQLRKNKQNKDLQKLQFHDQSTNTYTKQSNLNNKNKVNANKAENTNTNNSMTIIRSRKQIQDQQLRQIEEQVRKEEGGKIKKGNYKINNKINQEILPFQSGVEPFFPQTKTNKKQKRTKNQQQKLAELNQLNDKNINLQLNKKNVNQNEGQQSNSLFKTNLQLNQLSRNSELSQNQTLIKKKSSANLSNLSALTSAKLSNQIKSKNDISMKTQGNLINRGNKNSNKHNSMGDVKEITEDLTEDNKIKGYKVPEKVIKQTVRNNEVRRQNSKNNLISNPIQRQNVNNKKQTNLNKNLQRHSQNNKDETSRTVKMQNRRQQNSMSVDPRNRTDGDFIKQNNHTQEGNRNIKSPNKETNPRNAIAHDKEFYFKNWKEAEIQKAQKESRDAKKRRQSKNKSQSGSKDYSKSNKKSDFINKKQGKDRQIDLDAKPQDKFGLLSQKKPSNKKVKITEKKINKNQTETKKDQSESFSDIEEQSEEGTKNQDNINHKVKANLQQLQLNQEKNQGQINEFNKQNEKNRGEKSDTANENPSLSRISSIGSVRGKTMEADIQFETNQTPFADNANLQNADELNQNQKRKQQNLQKLLQAANQEHSEHLDQQLIKNGKNNDNKIIENNILPINKEEEKKQHNCKDENIEKQKRGNEATHIQSTLKQGNAVTQQNEMLNQNTDQKHKNKEQQSSLICSSQPVQLNNKKCELSQLSQQVNQVSSSTAKVSTANAQQFLYQKLESDNLRDQNATGINKSDDFFQYNIKEMSKINQTLNQTFNNTKYESFDKDTNNYSRAPILSFFYNLTRTITDDIDKFHSSTTKLTLLQSYKQSSDLNDPLIDQAINILISIDPWIIQRIFEPFEDQKGNIGIWLYCHGAWKLFIEQYSTNYKHILKNALQDALAALKQTRQLQKILRLISGVRIMKLRSNKRKVFNELQYSLKKGHVLRAATAKESKWGERLFQVVKVQVTKQGQNVLQIKQKQETYWVKQQKFKQIFEHFLLVCTRKAHFWTNKQLSHQPLQKAVITITSQVPAHGSITLFYPSQQKSSLLLYKQLQSKVLKYMGKIQQKVNQNCNLYFQFRLHGTYYLFLETPTTCNLSIESTGQLQIGQPQFIKSSTLRNEQCEYVQLNKVKGERRTSSHPRNQETLQKLRDKFIKMVSKN